MKNKLILAIVTLLCACALCGCQEEKPKSPDFSRCEDIAELATIECFYHNVAEIRNEGIDVLPGLLSLGYKKAWFEYTGSVEMGIDASEVAISEPDINGVVTIAVPQARVLGIPKVDRSSFSELYTDLGLLTRLTAADKTGAFQKAQDDMTQRASSDTRLLNQARGRAKLLLEQYVINVGKALGQDYKVEFVDVEPKDTSG